MPYLPPEWHPQQAVLLVWPHLSTDWINNLQQAESSYLIMTQAIIEHGEAWIVCRDKNHLQQVAALIDKHHVNRNQIKLSVAAYNDTWVRDYGPITLIEKGQRVFASFEFNAWGDKYACADDNRLTEQLFQQGALGHGSVKNYDWVLEGGSIETDGNGSLMVTSTCLLNNNRNRSASKKVITDRLMKSFGMEQVHWIDFGHLQGDDTDSHIDTLARFAPDNVIVYQGCESKGDCHYDELQRMTRQLSQLRTTSGERYDLLPLPLPAPIFNQAGQRLPASYANFLITNGAVLMPIYEDSADEVALKRLETVFPERTLVPIPALPLIEQFGSVHCLTMQIPVAGDT